MLSIGLLVGEMGDDMLRTILVGLSEAPEDNAAVRLGIDWAKRFDSLLVGVGVVNEPAIRGSVTHPREGGYLSHLQSQWLHEAQRRVEGQLEAFAKQCAEAQVACKLLEDVGVPWQEILREAQRYDLVMLSQAGEFEGEVASRSLYEVLRACPRPLVVVPTATAISGQGEVLIAYDGSIQAARALHMFVASGLNALGPVRVLAIHAGSKVEAAKIADRAAQYLDSHGIAATVCPLQSAVSPSDVICEQAAAQPTQLLVMGACGRSRLAEFFVGSVTTSLVERCPVPLFLYH